MHVRPPRPAALLFLLLAGCTGPFLDQPSKSRETRFFLPPVFTLNSSPDGTSYDWNALLWLVGQDVESGRTQSRALPIWWQDDEGPYLQTTMLFPLWYSRTTQDSTLRFFTPLYGYSDSPEEHTDYVLPPVFWNQYAKDGSHRDTWLLFVVDDEERGEQSDVTIASILGLASLLHVQTGLPPDGENVPADGRTSSRRITGPSVLGLVTAFGYDDVGDRRDIRVLTLLSSERISLFRSWRGRGDDPFVREWLFPLYMNVQDAGSGWEYVGPLWGQYHDGARSTDWWLLGLLSHTTEPAGDTWRVAGIPVSAP